MRKELSAVILLLLAALFAGCGKKEGSTEPHTITLERLDAKPVTLNYKEGKQSEFKHLDFPDFNGKIIFLNFFSSTCGSCRKEIPHLIQLQEKYKEQLVVLGILVENRPLEALRPFVEQFKINYPIIEPGANYKVAELVGGVYAVPAMYLYDQNGDFFQNYLGAVPQEMLENDIKKLLDREVQP